MPTAYDYERGPDGKLRLRENPKTSVESSARYDVTDGKPRPKLIWAKDIQPEPEQEAPNLWGDFLWPGSIHVLSGEPGVGKTTFLYNLAVNSCLGESLLGIPFAGTIKCVYLDLETPPALRARKLHLISENRPPDGLAFITSANLEQDAAWLTDVIRMFGFKLMVVDTINEAFSTIDEDSNSEANLQMALTRRLVADTGVSVLLVQHIGKGETKKVYRCRGASARPASADVVLNLESISEDIIRLEVAKNRWVGGTPKLFLKKIGEDLFEPTEVLGEESVTQKVKAQQFVLEVLEQNGGATQTCEIMAAGKGSGFSSATLERELSSLVQLGKVLRPQRGHYVLAEKPSITSPQGVEVIDGSDGFVTERLRA